MARSRYTKAGIIYARTLLELVREKNDLATVTLEMQALWQLFASMPALKLALENPVLAADKKATLIQPLVARGSNWTARLLKLLVTKRRVAVLPALVEAYLRLEEESRNILRAKVISAKAFSPDQLTQLAKNLSVRRPGKTYLLENKVDESLIAGFRVEEGDHILDASFRFKLDTLKQKLAA
jgi:F-type H+-transporting ATPase subunit delta